MTVELYWGKQNWWEQLGLILKFWGLEDLVEILFSVSHRNTINRNNSSFSQPKVPVLVCATLGLLGCDYHPDYCSGEGDWLNEATQTPYLALTICRHFSNLCMPFILADLHFESRTSWLQSQVFSIIWCCPLVGVEFSSVLWSSSCDDPACDVSVPLLHYMETA